jgi:hypothetical protein
MGVASSAFQAVGGIVSAVGSIFTGSAQQSAANYNAQIQLKNAQQAKINSQIAGQAGNAQVEAQELRNRAGMGSLKAMQGASGIDVNSESSTAVEQSQREIGQLDALTVRSNATREAYGYATQAQSYTEKAALEKAQGENAATASYINAGSSLLNSASNASASWQEWQDKGGLSTSDIGIVRSTPMVRF